MMEQCNQFFFNSQRELTMQRIHIVSSVPTVGDVCQQWAVLKHFVAALQAAPSHNKDSQCVLFRPKTARSQCVSGVPILFTDWVQSFLIPFFTVHMLHVFCEQAGMQKAHQFDTQIHSRVDCSSILVDVNLGTNASKRSAVGSRWNFLRFDPTENVNTVSSGENSTSTVLPGHKAVKLLPCFWNDRSTL